MANEARDGDGAVGLAEAGRDRPTHVRYGVLATACALAVITYLHRVGFATASNEFRRPLGLDDQQMSYLFAAFMIAYGAFEVPWGYLGDRFGVRNLLAIIALGGSLTTAAVALVAFLPARTAAPLVLLIVLRFLFGLFQAGTFPTIARMTADWMPATERGSAQGFIWTSSRLGGALAPQAVIVLFHYLGDWKGPLALLAGLGVLWTAAFWPWFHNRPEAMPQVNAAEQALIAAGRKASRQAGHGDVPWARLVRSGNVWALCFMYAFLGFSGNFFLTLLPTYLGTHRHLDSKSTSLLTTIPFACGIVTCLLGGFLSDLIIRRTGNRRWGRSLVGMAGLALASVSILATTRVESTWLLALLLGLTFAGNDLAMGPAWAAAADIGGRFAGTVGGAMNMLNALVATVGLIAVGRLFHGGYLVLPFLLFAGSYALGVLCWLRIDATEPVDGPDALAAEI